jgi:hypothetical protein
MVNCKNFPFCRKKQGERSKTDASFPNDFDKKDFGKKVKGSE